MGYPVSYSGAIEVQPPLSDAHAKLVEVCVDLKGSEDLRPTLEAIKSSEEPDLPYHSGQTYISEDSSKIEACQGEQRHGLRLWLVHLVKHFFIPQATPSMARFHGTLLTTLRTSGVFTSKTMRSKLLTS